MPKKTTKKVAKKAIAKKAAVKKATKKTARKKTAKKAPAPAPTEEEISHAAYLNFMSRVEQGVHGDEEGDWTAAEKSLKDKK